MKKLLTLSILLLGLSACGQTDDPVPATAVPLITEQTAQLPELPTVEPTIPATKVSVPESQSAAEEPATAVAPTPEPTGQTVVPTITPIEVTYLTPAQQEGPYYTLDKPADHDNDLVDYAGASGAPLGQELHLSGIVYNANGLPLEGLSVEIWQTDAAGVYLHPQDPSTESRDPNFQFYGESVTAADGVYRFRTILPGLYEPRPRHIHVKVKQDGQELLTTQFYFAGEIDLQGNDAAMLVTTARAENDAGSPILIGERDIILAAP